MHTSLYEAQGVAIAEAAASQLLVAGTHVGLIADLGTEATISVPPGDSSSLAENILQVIKDPNKMSQLRSNAYRWACEHTADWTSGMYTQLYEQILTR